MRGMTARTGGTMRYISGLLRNVQIASVLLCLAESMALGQARGPMTIQATAKGTSTQLGKLLDVNIHIEAYSTPDDQKVLIEAFKARGQDGLIDALQDMKSKGRIRFSSGGVGNDVKYIMELPADSGRRFRLVTDRNLAFGELYNGTRSRDYSVGAIELVLTPDGKGSGTVLPACKLTVDKKTQQIEIETYQNPWKLSNFMVSKD